MDSTNFDNFYELKKKYNELILLIYDISGESKLKTFIENVEDNDLEMLISNFCNNIENDKKIRKLFLNRNERLFSETNNVKLIPSFNLKSFLTNCNDNSYIWECIQLLYAIYRSGNDKYKDLVTKVVGKIFCSWNNPTNNLWKIFSGLWNNFWNKLLRNVGVRLGKSF